MYDVSKYVPGTPTEHSRRVITREQLVRVISDTWTPARTHTPLVTRFKPPTYRRSFIFGRQPASPPTRGDPSGSDDIPASPRVIFGRHLRHHQHEEILHLRTTTCVTTNTRRSFIFGRQPASPPTRGDPSSSDDNLRHHQHEEILHLRTTTCVTTNTRRSFILGRQFSVHHQQRRSSASSDDNLGRHHQQEASFRVGHSDFTSR